MSRRLLLLIVALLSLCFCVLVTFGVVDEPKFAGRLDLKAPSFAQLRRRFTARLPASQMRLVSGAGAGCRLDPARLTAPEGETCVYAIQPDAGKTRQLSLVLGGDGQSVRLALTQPNAISVDQTLESGKAIDLDIYKNDQDKGAELRFEACVVVKPEKEEDRKRAYVCALEIRN
jgi:hypothetical protein